MGPWRDLYERDWRAFASRALTDAFGDAPPATTDEDRAYLVALLGSMGVRGHAAPLPPALLTSSRLAGASTGGDSHDTQPLDELLSDADASTSYVYATPRKQDPDLSTQFFPRFSAQDFLPGDARRESASQTLRLRMADVSPIAPVREHSPVRYYSQRYEQFQQGIEQDAGSGLSTPRTGSPSSPSVPESLDAAVLRSGDEEFQTPRPSGCTQRERTGLRERRSALRELSVRESRVGDLDVSMQSMNLSDDGFMIIDNADGDEAGATHDVARADHTRTPAYTQDQEHSQVREEHDQVPKVLNFSSDSEDEEMEYEFGDAQPDGEPDDADDQGEGMDLTYDDSAGDCGDGGVVRDAEREGSFAVEIKVELESEGFELLGVIPAPAALPEAAFEQLEVRKNRLNIVNASRESCDSVDSNQGSARLPRHRPVFQTRLPLEIEYRSTTDRRRRTQRRKSLLLKEIGPYREPEFRAELASYQQRAVAWMQAREAHSKQPSPGEKPNRLARITNRIRGGILADEMGLGKTVCCIGLICESLRESRRECQREATASGSSTPRIKPPTLIITPLSILGQWASEIRQKTNLSVISYHGSSRKTYRTAMDFMGADIVLSTYDTLRLKECKVGRSANRIDDDDGRAGGGQATAEEGEWRTILRNTAEDRRSFMGSKLHQLTWHRVILDESHLITNASCARARAAYSLQSKRRWCVTGTPIQNSSSDLVSLVGFLGISHDVDAELNDILPHIMLRRLKATVDSASREPILALPEKIEERVELLFANDLEEAFYTLLHRSTKKQVMQYLQSRDAQPQFMHVFELILRLRQTCNSFALVTQDPVTEVRGSGTLLLAEASASMTPGAKHTRLIQRAEARYASDQLRGVEVLPKSTKLCALVSHLKAVRAKKEKALVISQWTGFLDLISESLESYNAASDSARAISFGKLDGRMSARERDQTVAWFQQDKRLDVLLISLRTGGMGLNLTAASHVFIMEPSWNPSVESQAIDRAHRFGQERPVRVVRFIMKNTIEERMVELQKKKRELAKNLLGDAAVDAASRAQPETRLTRAELRQLFTQGQPDEW